MTSGGIAKKYLDASDIELAIADVARLAKNSGVRVALVGGAAMQLYGSERLTKDVDFIASGALADLAEIKPLVFGGYQTQTSGVPVDWILRDDDYAGLYEEALNVAKVLPGSPVRVVSPEYLAAMKMAAGRRKDEDDLRALLRSDALDIEATEKVIRSWLGRYGVQSFRAFAREAKFLEEEEKHGRL
jgi:hypothetical protein